MIKFYDDSASFPGSLFFRHERRLVSEQSRALRTRKDCVALPRRCASLEAILREFRSRELASRRLPKLSTMATDALLRLILLFTGYAGMLLIAFPAKVVPIAIFAIADTSVLGSWFHDSVHLAVRSTPGITIMKFVGRIGAAPVGFSPRWWFYKHVKMHHRYVNNPEFDPDIQFGYLARVCGSQPWRWPHAMQHIYIWFLLPFSTINMLKPSEIWTIRRLQRYKGIGNPPPVWVFLVDRYIPCLAVWSPVFYYQGPKQGILCFLAFQLIAGTLVSVITQVQHNTALADDSDDYSMRWPLCEQLARTTDVGKSKGLWWWLSGGTNFHVAHHLIPTVSFQELPAVTARLRAELAANGIHFPAHRSIFAAVKSHFRLLRRLARKINYCSE